MLAETTTAMLTQTAHIFGLHIIGNCRDDFAVIHTHLEDLGNWHADATCQTPVPLKTQTTSCSVPFCSLTSSLPHLSRHLPPAPQSNPPQRRIFLRPCSSQSMADHIITRNKIFSRSKKSSLPPRKRSQIPPYSSKKAATRH